MEHDAFSDQEIELIAGPGAASLARAALVSMGVLRQRIDDVLLATSEVVTNAVRHGGLRRDVDAVHITVHTGRDTLRVTVEQPTSAEGVRIQTPRVEGGRSGGFGLGLVDEVVDDWGYEPGPPGRVWFEFGVPPDLPS